MASEKECTNVNGISEDSATDVDPVSDNDEDENIDEAYTEG